MCDPSVSSCLTPRREIEELLDGGLLANASPDAILAADRNPWDPYEGERYFYCQHTGRRWKYVWTTTGASRENLAALSGRPCGDGEGPALLRVRYVAPGRLGGYAVTGRMHYLRADACGILREAGVRGVRLAVRRRGAGGPDQPFVLHARRADPGGRDAGPPLTLRPCDMRRTARTRNWTIYEVALPCPLMESESAWLELPAGP